MKYNSYLVKDNHYPLVVLQKKAEKLKAEGRDIINLTIGDPKDDTYSPIKDTLIAELGRRSFSQYPKHAGDAMYLQAVSDWANAMYGERFDPQSEILSCNGSKEAIFMLPLLFDWASTQKKIFIPSLSYPVYAASADLMSVPVHWLPLSKETGFLPDLDSITEEEWKSCGIFWINSPHNPTTAIASKKYLEKLCDYASRYDFLICSDECYNDLYYAEQPASCLEIRKSDRWLVFRSLSKRSHMTGFRIGAMISRNKELIQKLKQLRGPMGVGTPTFIQKAAITAWNDMAHPKKNSEEYHQKRDLVLPILEKKGFEVFGAQAGFYFWFSHPNFTTSQELCDLFLDQGLLITPGTAFGDQGEGFARMIYCETMPVIKDVCQRLKQLKVT